MKLSRILTLALAATGAASVNAQAVFSGAGLGSATSALTGFRAAIGGANNGPGGPAQATGRREINWDAAKLDGTDPNPATQVLAPGTLVSIPRNRFAARGLLTATPYAVSGSVNPSIAGQFNAFSPKNTFAMANDHRLRMSFLLPGTDTVGKTRGFGAIFNDVELEGETTMELFNGVTSLGIYNVPVTASGGTSFLGVLFDDAQVTNVTLTLGNANLFTLTGGVLSPGASELTEGIDLVGTDDFVFAEPIQAVPEAAPMGAMALGTLALLKRRKWAN